MFLVNLHLHYILVLVYVNAYHEITNYIWPMNSALYMIDFLCKNSCYCPFFAMNVNFIYTYLDHVVNLSV